MDSLGIFVGSLNSISEVRSGRDRLMELPFLEKKSSINISYAKINRYLNVLKYDRQKKINKDKHLLGRRLLFKKNE